MAEGLLRSGRRRPGAWENRRRTRASDASFCHWKRHVTSSSPSIQGRRVTSQCWLCAGSSQVLGPVMLPAPLRGSQCTSAWYSCMLSTCSPWLRDCYGVISKRRAPSLKPVCFVSWLVSGSRIGCCRIGSAWEQHWGWGSAAAPAPSAVKPPDHGCMHCCTVLGRALNIFLVASPLHVPHDKAKIISP